MPYRLFQSSRRIDLSVYSERFFFGLPGPPKEVVLYLIKRQFESGTTVIADLAGSTRPFNDRFLVNIHVQDVDWARGNTGAAHHAVVSADHLIEEVPPDLRALRRRPTVSHLKHMPRTDADLKRQHEDIISFFVRRQTNT